MLWLIFAMSLGEVVMMFFGVTIFVGPPPYRFRAVPLPEALLAAVGSKVSQKIVKSSISAPKRDSGKGNDPWRIAAWRDGLCAGEDLIQEPEAARGIGVGPMVVGGGDIGVDWR